MHRDHGMVHLNAQQLGHKHQRAIKVYFIFIFFVGQFCGVSSLEFFWNLYLKKIFPNKKYIFGYPQCKKIHPKKDVDGNSISWHEH
jgi:hypothetical protein